MTLAESSDLSAWLQRRNCDVDAFKAHHSVDQKFGNQLLAAEDLKAGLSIARINNSALINKLTLSGHYPDLCPPLSSIQIVCLHLALHRNVDFANGDDLFLPFIKTIPRTFTLPLFYTHCDDKNLSSHAQRLLSTAPSDVQELLLDVNKRYERDLKAILKHWPDYYDDRPAFVGYSREIARADILWAWAAMNSRCIWFDLGEADRNQNMTLCPFIDFANHDPTSRSKPRIEIGGDMVLYSSLPGGDSQDNIVIEKGHEICLSYGPHDNGTLLAEYGFVLDRNEREKIDVRAQVMLRFETLPRDESNKLDILLEERLEHSLCFDLYPELQPSYNLMLALRLLCLSTAVKRRRTDRKDARLYNDWYRLKLGEIDEISEENERQSEAICLEIIHEERTKAVDGVKAVEQAAKALSPEVSQSLDQLIQSLCTIWRDRLAALSEACGGGDLVGSKETRP